MVKKIAVTGGIGSGKSVVLQCAKELGYQTFSCDEIYKDVINSREYVERIKVLFPDCIIENTVNRKKLAEIVFNNPKSLQKLNAVAHPMIMHELYCKIGEISKGIVFAEVPLLFENGYEKDFHETIFVKRSLEDRIREVSQRDRISREEILKRIKAQFDPESEEGMKKLKKCKAHVLENNSNILYVKTWLQNFICETVNM